MKLSLLVLMGAIIVGLSSCKKDYNCVCNYQALGVDQTDIHEIKDVKRETAKDKCNEIEEETDLLFSDVTCDIE